MTNSLFFVALPLVTGFTAWLVVWVLVRMVIYPIQPRRVMGMRWQGLLAGHQQAIAAAAGAAAARQIATAGSGVQLADSAVLAEMEPLIAAHLDTYLRVRLKEKLPAVAAFIGEKTMVKLKEGMMEEIALLLPQIVERYTASLTGGGAMEQQIAAAVGKMSAEDLTALAMPAYRQLRYTAPLLAGGMGVLAGTVLALVWWWAVA
jgi:hypothetical protein